jgi:hypothetical protein
MTQDASPGQLKLIANTPLSFISQIEDLRRINRALYGGNPLIVWNRVDLKENLVGLG